MVIPFECESEDEARDRCSELIQQKKWPCYFFKSDTTGEKDFGDINCWGWDLTFYRHDVFLMVDNN